jgi:transcription initiation factor TFIIIB Brf1 subunit/transcription initiation factor TFIIB
MSSFCKDCNEEVSPIEKDGQSICTSCGLVLDILYDDAPEKMTFSSDSKEQRDSKSRSEFQYTSIIDRVVDKYLEKHHLTEFNIPSKLSLQPDKILTKEKQSNTVVTKQNLSNFKKVIYTEGQENLKIICGILGYSFDSPIYKMAHYCWACFRVTTQRISYNNRTQAACILFALKYYKINANIQQICSVVPEWKNLSEKRQLGVIRKYTEKIKEATLKIKGEL